MAHAEGLEPPKAIKPRRFSGPFPHPAGLRAYNLCGDQPSLRTRRHLTFTAPTIQRSANEALDASRLLQ